MSKSLNGKVKYGSPDDTGKLEETKMKRLVLLVIAIALVFAAPVAFADAAKTTPATPIASDTQLAPMAAATAIQETMPTAITPQEATPTVGYADTGTKMAPMITAKMSEDGTSVTAPMSEETKVLASTGVSAKTPATLIS